MDKVFVRDLALRCVIGVFPEERNITQDVLVNLELECDTRPASFSDQLVDAVDYKELKGRIVHSVESSSFHLIESLAECVAQICLETQNVKGAKVTIDKPGALRYARSVAVEIYRTKEPR